MFLEWVILLKKIVIVEDDKKICQELAEVLKNAGYLPFVLNHFKEAKDDILKQNPDLILLDIHIPYTNGQVLLQNLRQESNVPIIMVTSQNTECDEILSMSYGADDYITKPYNPNVLLLHIAAILKRSKEGNGIDTYHDLEIHIQKGIIKNKDRQVILTKNEMIVFSYLFHHKDRIVSRDELMTDLWNNEEYVNDNALTVNISRLRAKLKDLGVEDAIDTRKGQGYILK